MKNNNKKWIIEGLIYAGIMTSINILIPLWYDEEIAVLKVGLYLVFWLMLGLSLSYAIRRNGNKKRR